MQSGVSDLLRGGLGNEEWGNFMTVSLCAIGVNCRPSYVPTDDVRPTLSQSEAVCLLPCRR